jgi:hypothetical protein
MEFFIYYTNRKDSENFVLRLVSIRVAIDLLMTLLSHSINLNLT